MQFAKKSTLLSMLFCFAFCLPALAQTRAGEANGTVTDASGAVVPGAAVTLTNTATNIQDHTTTNGSGVFRFVNVAPGTYTLKVEKSGFKSDQTNFQVAVNQAVTQNMTLNVGNAETTVEVTAQAPVLDSTSSSLGAVIEEKTVQNLPLNGRNFTQLLTLTPGVTPVSTSQNKSIGGVEGNVGLPGSQFADPSFYGQFNRSKLYFFDGIINTNIRGPTYIVIPDPDIVREFKVTGQDSQAEVGGAMGGVVNMVSTSGTNKFHGSAFEYVRNNFFDARDEFKDLDANGNPKGAAPFHQNQFGATFGGPIIHDRTFFSFGYAGWRYSKPDQSTFYVPTAAELNGDFSSTSASGNSNTIFNPFTTASASPNGRSPFMCDAAGNPLPANAQGIQPNGTPCNKIPQGLINPAMQAFFKAYGATPNYSNPADPQHNFIQNRPSINNSDEYSIRVDHRFTERDNVFFRYTQQNNDTFTPIGEQASTSGGSPGRNYGADYVHMFGPTLILDVRGGYAGRPGVDSSQQNTHTAGLGPMTQAGFADIQKYSGMMVDLGNKTPWDNGGNRDFGIRGPALRENPTRSLTPSITWLKGNHNIKAGFWYIDASRVQKNTFQTWVFSGTQTSNPANTSNTGLSLASALLGIPDSGSGQLPSRQGGEVDFSYASYAGYLQDEWKMARNVTITAGLRYDYLTQPHTNDGRLWNSFDLQNQLWIVGAKTLPGLCSAVGQAPCIPDAFQTDPHFNNVVAAGKSFFAPPPIKDNWGPRLGLAWQIHPKTVIRTGAGLYWDSLAARSQYAQNDLEAEVWPDAIAFATPTINSSSQTAGGNVQFLNSLQGHFPVTLPPTSPWGIGGFSDDPRYKDPYSIQYHVEVQQELSPSSVFSISYVGSRDGRLPYNGKANAARAASPPNTCAKNDAACNKKYKDNIDLLRPVPWAGINNYSMSVGTSHYNGLLTRYQHRFSGGLSTLISYTFSKSIDTTSGYFGVENGPGGGSVVESFWDRSLARGVSGFDVTHFLSWANVYELPAGRGKRFFQSGPLSWILGNWETESILQARSGAPYTLQVSGDIANLQGNSPSGPGTYGRPNIISDPFVAGPVMSNPDPLCHFTTAQIVPAGQPGAGKSGSAPLSVGNSTNYYNPCAFTQPIGSFGNLGRDVYRGPAIFNTDFSLTKQIPVAEGKTLELHFQFFNLFNVQNWAPPSAVQINSSGTTINPKAGQITALETGTTPREMQFGLHFRF